MIVQNGDTEVRVGGSCCEQNANNVLEVRVGGQLLASVTEDCRWICWDRDRTVKALADFPREEADVVPVEDEEAERPRRKK